jgi:tRNA uridine 5-carbamoylmethylation protein Kti12
MKRYKETLIVNLYSAPGGGKSTTASRIFVYLKEHGYNCELVTEYAKDITWEEAFNKLNNQIYIFAKQHHRVWRVSDKVDVIITDSPILLSLVYGKDITSKTFETLVMEEYNKFPHINVYLERMFPYDSVGRSQDENGAKLIEKDIHNLFDRLNLNFDLQLVGDNTSTNSIIELIDKKLTELEKNIN